MPVTFREKLRSITVSLLDTSRPAYSLRSQVLELKSIFENAGGAIVDKTQDIGAGEIRTTSGLAISPTMASMCVDDFARTVQFIRGLHEAIADLREIIRDRPLRVLYAGCGPWATLAVPVMSVLSPSEVTFTLIDIHETSTASARSLIERLELSDSVDDIKTIDATEYVIEAGASPDILLIEMMRATLDEEPQVVVAMNLSRQVPDAVLIPEDVRIDLALINPSREFTLDGSIDDEPIERDRIDVGEVLVLNKTHLVSTDDEHRPETSLQLPEFDTDRYRPMLTTTIRVYGEYSLKDYDSGITCPKPLPFSAAVKPGETLEFKYEVGRHPGLRVRHV